MSAHSQFDQTDQRRLSPLARRLVEALERAEGRLVSRAALIDELWAGNHLVGEPALNRLVSEARRGLRDAGEANLIETVQRSGYRWAALSDGPQTTSAAPLRRINYRPWVLGFIAVVVLLALAGWVVEEATGMIWVARHGG